MHISFGAGCYHIAYHIGVLEVLQKNKIIQANDVFSGSSSGAIIAVFAACDIDAHSIFFSELPKIKNTQDLCKRLRCVLTDVLPKNAHILCSSRCNIYVTDMNNLEPLVLNHFTSKDDLIDAVVASCFAPKVTSSNIQYMYKGRSVIDGGITAFNPNGDIKISCVSEHIIKYLPIKNKTANISRVTLSCPFSPKALTWMLYKGPTSYYVNLYNTGKKDAEKLFTQ